MAVHLHNPANLGRDGRPAPVRPACVRALGLDRVVVCRCGEEEEPE